MLVKKNIFFFLILSIINISFIAKEIWQKNCVEVITFDKKKWLNEKVQLQHSNLPHITNQYSSELKKERQELQNCGKCQLCRKF